MGTTQLDLAIHISCLKCHLSRLFKSRKHTSTLQKPSDCNRESTRIVYCIRPITDQAAIYIDLHDFTIQNFRFHFPTFSERVFEEKKAKVSRWHVQSKQLVSLQVERHQGSNLQPRLHVSLHQLPVVSRSHIVIARELLLFVRLGNIRRVLSF